MYLSQYMEETRKICCNIGIRAHNINIELLTSTTKNYYIFVRYSLDNYFTRRSGERKLKHK